MVTACQNTKPRHLATYNTTNLETIEIDLRGMTAMQCSDPTIMRQTGSQPG